MARLAKSGTCEQEGKAQGAGHQHEHPMRRAERQHNISLQAATKRALTVVIQPTNRRRMVQGTAHSTVSVNTRVRSEGWRPYARIQVPCPGAHNVPSLN
jgi:hypothetical protein